MASNRDLKQLIEEAEERGWTVKKGGNAYRWTFTNGEFFFSTLTPQDWRAVKNIRSDMNKIERAAKEGKPSSHFSNRHRKTG